MASGNLREEHPERAQSQPWERTEQHGIVAESLAPLPMQQGVQHPLAAAKRAVESRQLVERTGQHPLPFGRIQQQDRQEYAAEEQASLHVVALHRLKRFSDGKDSAKPVIDGKNEHISES